MKLSGQRKTRSISLLRIFTLLGVFLTFAAGMVYASRYPSYVINADLNGRTVAIDPGHGGVDSGAFTSTNALEKDINLDIALRLKAVLEQSHARVIMTRERDMSLEKQSSLNAGRHLRDLDARCGIINTSGADGFVSIHTNCLRDRPGKKGAIVFYYKESQEGKLMAEFIAAAVDREIYSRYLRNDGMKTEIIPQDYYVLQNTHITGVLIEVGFLTNGEEAGLLRQPEYRSILAAAIGSGLADYFAVENEVQEDQSGIHKILKHF